VVIEDKEKRGKEYKVRKRERIQGENEGWIDIE